MYLTARTNARTGIVLRPMNAHAHKGGQEKFVISRVQPTNGAKTALKIVGARMTLNAIQTLANACVQRVLLANCVIQSVPRINTGTNVRSYVVARTEALVIT